MHNSSGICPSDLQRSEFLPWQGSEGSERPPRTPPRSWLVPSPTWDSRSSPSCWRGHQTSMHLAYKDRALTSIKGAVVNTLSHSRHIAVSHPIQQRLPDMQVTLWTVWAEWTDPDKSPNILIFFFFSSILKTILFLRGNFSEDSLEFWVCFSNVKFILMICTEINKLQLKQNQLCSLHTT